MKASPVMQQQQQLLQNRGRAVGIGGYGRCGRSVGMSSSPWPVPSSQPQLQSGSGMRAVFLDGSGSKKGSSGTGVFLPRRVGNPVELRKKPGWLFVLLYSLPFFCACSVNVLKVGCGFGASVSLICSVYFYLLLPWNIKMACYDCL